MKGYVHDEDFFIVHDDLVLITEKDTTSWIRENNYSHRWLLPINGFQYGTPYDGRPVVDSPESMTLDNSLNIDIFHTLKFHCVLSCFVL